MLYESLQMFLNYFCTPIRCSSQDGMEFLVDASKIAALRQDHALYRITLLIASDMTEVKILVIYEESIQVSSCCDPKESSFQLVMKKIEEMAIESCPRKWGDRP